MADTASTSVSASKQVRASSGTQSSWGGARDAASSNTFTTFSTPINISYAIEIDYNIGARGDLWSVNRTFLYFDVSSVPGTITGLQLKIYGVFNGDLNVIAVKSTAFSGDGSTNYANDEFDAWSPDSPTDYSSQTSGWTTGGYNTIALNSTAVSESNSNGFLIIALVDYDFDHQFVNPSGTYPTGVTLDNGIRFASSSQPLYLDIDYTPAATGYTEIVNSVIPANIGAINGVDTFDIIRVNNAPPVEDPWYISYITTGSNANITALITGSSDGFEKYPVIDKGGTRLYINSGFTKQVIQLSLSSPNDITSISSVGKSSALSYFFKSMQISDDGTKMAILDYTNDRINQHSLSTAWDITTLSTTTSSFLSITNPDILRNIHYNGDGTKLYACTVDDPPNIVNIHSWDLSTPYDISTAGAETVNNVYSVLNSGSGFQYRNIVAFDTPQNSYVILGSGGIPEGYVFKNGINTGSLWDSGSYDANTPYGANANDENHIYYTERVGSAPGITHTLYQLYTNIF